MTFSEWKGYSVAWNQKLKSGTKIGISFDHSFKTKPYSWVYTSVDYDHQPMVYKTYIESRDPYNQRFSATAFVGWCPRRNEHAAIFWGPTLGINWFRIHEKIHRFANEWFVDADYYTLANKKARLSPGIFIEFEIFRIFTDRLSATMRLHSTLAGYNNLFSWDRSEPQLITLTGADIGLKWNFGRLEGK
jgi:hypothetical protein